MGLDYLGDVVAGSKFRGLEDKEVVCYYLPAKDFRRLHESERRQFR